MACGHQAISRVCRVDDWRRLRSRWCPPNLRPQSEVSCWQYSRLSGIIGVPTAWALSAGSHRRPQLRFDGLDFRIMKGSAPQLDDACWSASVRRRQYLHFLAYRPWQANNGNWTCTQSAIFNKRFLGTARSPDRPEVAPEAEFAGHVGSQHHRWYRTHICTVHVRYVQIWSMLRGGAA